MKWIMLLLHVIGTVSATAAILGIDFGTDFLKASLVAPNAPFEIVLTPDSNRKDASGLVVKPHDGDRIYGSAGVSLVSRFPSSSFYGMKSLLGSAFDDLKLDLFKETYPGLQPLSTSRNSVAFNISGTVVPIEELVAMQLSEAVTRGTQMVREKTNSKRAQLKTVAMSVPSRFGLLERQALADSAQLAKLELINLVSDGVAVAINYANSPVVSSKLTNNTHHRIIVYDVGASGASATLVNLQVSSVNNQVVNVEVEGTGYTTELGGHVLTRLLREIIIGKFETIYGKVERTPRLLNRLWREAERAKHVLSANAEVNIHIESLADENDLSCKISREEFENFAKPQINLVLLPLQEALGSYQLSDIATIVLVGGATRTPFILDVLTAEVGEAKLSKNVNADEANVQGTAMRGINLSGIYRSKRYFNVSDVSTYNYTAVTYDLKGHKDTLNVFEVGSLLGSSTQVNLSRNTSKILLYEGKRKILTWELPYIKENFESLFDSGPYTCINDGELRGTFVLDNNGIVSLKAVEAICDSKKTQSITKLTNATSSDDSVGSESTNSTNETSTTSLKKEVTTTEAFEVSASQETKIEETEAISSTLPVISKKGSAVENNHTKIRHVVVQSKWEQAPLNAVEKSQIMAHLESLNKKDANRKEHSVLYHELESLAYKIRGLMDGNSSTTMDLREIAERMLSHVEHGDGELSELKSLLNEARRLYEQITNPDAASEVISDAFITSSTEVSKSTVLEANVEPSDDSQPEHNEL